MKDFKNITKAIKLVKADQRLTYDELKVLRNNVAKFTKAQTLETIDSNSIAVKEGCVYCGSTTIYKRKKKVPPYICQNCGKSSRKLIYGNYYLRQFTFKKFVAAERRRKTILAQIDATMRDMICTEVYENKVAFSTCIDSLREKNSKCAVHFN